MNGIIDSSAVVDELVRVLRAGGGRVGDGVAPADRTVPYHLVHTIPGGMAEGSWANPSEDLALVVQVDSVGMSRAQAQYAAHVVRRVVLGRVNGAWATVLADEGWRVFHRELDVDAGVEREGLLFTATDRFRLYVTASGSVPETPTVPDTSYYGGGYAP